MDHDVVDYLEERYNKLIEEYKLERENKRKIREFEDLAVIYLYKATPFNQLPL